MRLAVVGSRNYPNKKEVWEFLQLLKGNKNISLVTGDAKGVDAWVLASGEKVELTVEVFKADWNGPLGKAAGFKRNEDLVKHCNKLVAFWDVASTGTAHSIRIAMMAGKLTKVVTPFGILRPEGQVAPEALKNSESPSEASEEPPEGPGQGEPVKVAERTEQHWQVVDKEMKLAWNRLDTQQKHWEELDKRVRLLEEGLGVKNDAGKA